MVLPEPDGPAHRHELAGGHLEVHPPHRLHGTRFLRIDLPQPLGLHGGFPGPERPGSRRPVRFGSPHPVRPASCRRVLLHSIHLDCFGRVQRAACHAG